MTRFKGVFLGDPHLSDITPESRVDDYTEAVFSKLEYVLEYCATKKIENLFILGDLFHRKSPNLNSHRLVSRIIKLFLKYKGRNVTSYTILGNHDFTTSIATLPKQPVNSLFEAGALLPVGLDGEPLFFDLGPFSVEVNGAPYSDRADGTEKSAEAYNLKYNLEDSFKIGLFHSTLLPDGKSFFGDWVNFKDVAGCLKADLVACGHYHPGYDPSVQEAHGKTWCNPGALSRGTADDHNLTRKIKFISFLYDPSTDKKLYTKTVFVPAPVAEEVFDVEKLKRLKEERKHHDSFINSLEDSDLTLDVSSVDQLCRLSDKLTNEPGVSELVNSFLVKAAASVDV